MSEIIYAPGAKRRVVEFRRYILNLSKQITNPAVPFTLLDTKGTTGVALVGLGRDPKITLVGYLTQREDVDVIPVLGLREAKFADGSWHLEYPGQCGDLLLNAKFQ